MYLLDYIRMKVNRAETHLRAFNCEATSFLHNAYTVITKEDHQTSRCIRRIEFHAMPIALGMELGEFLYCLRSGLEQTAWQLALPSARANSPKDICFPILEKVAKGNERRYRNRILGLFPDEVAKQIDVLQPYKGPGAPESHPLWQLNKLCNIDKHWIIPFNGREKRIFKPISPDAVVTSFDDDDAIEVSVPLTDKAQFDFDPKFPVEIKLGEWNTDIHGFFVCTVIPSFIHFDRPIIESIPIRFGDASPVYS